MVYPCAEEGQRQSRPKTRDESEEMTSGPPILRCLFGTTLTEYIPKKGSVKKGRGLAQRAATMRMRARSGPGVLLRTKNPFSSGALSGSRMVGGRPIPSGMSPLL